jgi:hypothetical protein
MAGQKTAISCCVVLQEISLCFQAFPLSPHSSTQVERDMKRIFSAPDLAIVSYEK